MEGGGIEPLQPVLKTGPAAKRTAPTKAQLVAAEMVVRGGDRIRTGAGRVAPRPPACKAGALRPASGHSAATT